jgi:flagellar basal-body rod protein FlgG
VNKGLYIAASAAVASERKFDIVANNLSNKETVGYKRDDLAFNSLLPLTAKRYMPSFTKESTGAWPYPYNESQVRYVDLGRPFTDYEAGKLIPTDNPLDLALLGDGFFTVATPNGPRYTKSGNFTIDTQGRIVTQEGFPVLGVQGEINVETPSLGSMDLRNLIISPEGRVYAESEEQDAFIELDQINLVRFDDPQRLVKEPGTYFRYEGAPEGIRPAMDTQVGQGYLESSNVDVFQTMVTMIDLLRGYEAYQKAVQAFDSIDGTAIERVARVG